jgi:hypothetical protein
MKGEGGRWSGGGRIGGGHLRSRGQMQQRMTSWRGLSVKEGAKGEGVKKSLLGGRNV